MVCPSSLISLIPTLILSVVLAYAAPLPSSSLPSSLLLLSERAAPVAPVAPAIVAPVAPVAPVIIAPVAPVAPVINQVKNSNNPKPSSFGQYYNPYHLRQGHVWHPRRVEEVEERTQFTLDSTTPSSSVPRQLLGRQYHLQPTQDQESLPTPDAAPCHGHEDGDEKEEPIVVVAPRPQDLEASNVALFELELEFETTITQALKWTESEMEELSIFAFAPQEEQCGWEETCEEAELGSSANEDAYDLILQYEEVVEEEEEEELDLERGWLGSEEGVLVQ